MFGTLLLWLSCSFVAVELSAWLDGEAVMWLAGEDGEAVLECGYSVCMTCGW